MTQIEHLTLKQRARIRKKVVCLLKQLKKDILSCEQLTSDEYVFLKKKFKTIVSPVYTDTTRPSPNYTIRSLYEFLKYIDSMIESQQTALLVEQSAMGFQQDME